MPELTVNNGFSCSHRFCNFVDTIQPIKHQYYSIDCLTIQNPLHDIPYSVDESVLFKKGIVKRIFVYKDTKSPCLEIKVGDD